MEKWATADMTQDPFVFTAALKSTVSTTTWWSPQTKKLSLLTTRPSLTIVQEKPFVSYHDLWCFRPPQKVHIAFMRQPPNRPNISLQRTPPSCKAIALLHHALPAERATGNGGKLGACCAPYIWNVGFINPMNTICLVVSTYPSEKYVFVSWDDDIPNIWKTCSKPQNQL